MRDSKNKFSPEPISTKQLITPESKKPAPKNFYEFLGGNFLPKAPNDLLASIDQSNSNKWAFLAEFIKDKPKNELIAEVVKERNQLKFEPIQKELNKVEEEEKL